LRRESGYPTEGKQNTTGCLATNILGHAIQDQRDYDAHLDYIHFNPVKHGWVARVADWPHSSFHRFVRLGLYPPEWAARRLLGKWDLE